MPYFSISICVLFVQNVQTITSRETTKLNIIQIFYFILSLMYKNKNYTHAILSRSNLRAGHPVHK